MNNTRIGTDLTYEDQRFVLRAFTHRFTRNHRPAWAREPRPDGTPYEAQFADDQEWLANTRFFVTRGGRLDHRYKYCLSNPTWPDRKI